MSTMQNCRYRGYNTCNHAILNGEKFYSVTIHRMLGLVDAGEIVLEATWKTKDFRLSIQR